MKKIAILLSAFLAAACAVEEDLERTAGGNQDLVYPPVVNADGEINPELFNVINLDYPGLERVKEYYEAGDYEYAAYYLLEYYRNRSSVSNPGVDAVIMNPSATASEINMADIGSRGRLPIDSYNLSNEPPDQNLSSKALDKRLTCLKVPIFSIMIAQDQTDVAINPIMTTLVTMSEAQTMSHIDICEATLVVTSVKVCVSILSTLNEKNIQN